MNEIIRPNKKPEGGVKKLRIESKKLAEEETGLVGIGALIVFIAIVIISVISAGALINATGMIEGQAYQTAERATDTVATGLIIQGITGTADGEGDELEEIQVMVKKVAGSPGVNLETTTVEILTAGDITRLEFDEDTADASHFTVEEVVDDRGGPTQLETMVDMSEIIINAEDIAEIEPNDEFEITLIPEVGFQTYADAFAPPTLEADSQYRIRV